MRATHIESEVGGGRRWRAGAMLVAALLALPGVAFCQPIAGAAAASPGEWRAEATRVRTLAENDAPRAYEAAQQLQATLPSDATAADRARALNLLSRIEVYLALTDPAAAHAHQAFDLAVKNGDQVGQAEADLNVALIAVNQGKFDEMVTATQHSVAVLEGVNRPDLLCEALLRTTAMYRRFEQFEESVAVAVQAMQIAKRSNNPLALVYAHQGLALAYQQSYRFAEGREHSLQMRVQARAAHSRLLEAYAVAGLAGWYSETGDMREAERLTREATAMFREIGVPFATSYGLYGLADIVAKQGRHKEAVHDLDEALEIYDQHPNRISQWFALNARSENYQALGDLAKADADAQRAYAVAKDLDIALYLSGSSTRLASIASAKGDYRRAYTLSVGAAELTAKAARDKAGPRLVQLINRYESESKQRQIDELTHRTEQQSAQLFERELQQRWSWTLLAGVIVALASGGVFVYRLRHSQRQLQALNQQLQCSERDIRALNADLEQRVQFRTLELRQQARYLRTLIDMLPMWAWFKDTCSRYLVVNQAHAAARGYTVAAMVGRSDLQLLPPPLARQQLAGDEEVLASRQRKITEECVTNPDGDVWMETYKAAVLDEDGTVLGTVGVARDISEHKAVEAAREAALTEAQHLARQRSQFLAQMSHELRTPLNGIMGFAQILQRDKTLNERQLRAVRIIHESGQHLLDLINDILDLARIDAGKLELFPNDTNLLAFLQVVCDPIRVKAEDKGVLFVLEAAADLPATVRVDEKRLRQVLLNLLSNAVKFTDSGQVSLRVVCLVPSGNDIAAHLRFEVADQGIGMSEAQMARLFHPFEQVAEATRREGGTGLGLAISRQLVRLMGGEIGMRSRLGKGSVFSFEIEVQVSHGHAQASTEQNAPLGYLGERRRILVVDDEPHNRAILVDALGGLDFRVAEAANGREALDAVVPFRPDLIVMDLAMPLMDGFEATRLLRQLPEGADLPIIVTSASATADAKARSRAAGANVFVTKPIQVSELLNAIAVLLHIDWISDRTAALVGDKEDSAPP